MHLNDPPVTVPPSGWAYGVDATGNATTIHLTTGNFVANDIYEFSYIAKDPTLNGLGFAAVRDFNSFIRYAAADDFGTANPLAGDVTRIYTEISSQPGRLLNDFRHLGFNEDESHRKVFDGLMQWVAAADGINMNYRWSQTGRTKRNRQDHLYLEGLFPFANQTLFDPISGTTDGRYKKCEATNTCPLAMEFYSSNEYWVKAASLFHTDPMGTVDLPDHPQARLYNLASKQHGGAGNPASKGNCQQFHNPLDSAPVQRALWEALDQWSTKGIAPPPSQVPRFCRRHARAAVAAGGGRFPEYPGRHLHRLEDDALPVQLRAQLLFDLCPDDQSAGDHAAVPGQSGERADLSELRAEDRQRRQRDRRHPVARIGSAAGNVHRMGAARGQLGERRLRGLRSIHPVQGDDRPSGWLPEIRVHRWRNATSPTTSIRKPWARRSTVS